MPIDVRKLIFSKEELLVAFQEFSRNKSFVDSQCAVESFEYVTVKNSDSDVETLKVTVTFVSPDPRHPIQVNLIEEQIIEVLITTCKDQGIPLPRKGHKFVKQHKEGLAMSMGLSEADLRAAQPI